jgi:hypothetical protein
LTKSPGSFGTLHFEHIFMFLFYSTEVTHPQVPRLRGRGYMADYRGARVCVAQEILGRDPAHFGLAAWF